MAVAEAAAAPFCRACRCRRCQWCTHRQRLAAESHGRSWPAAMPSEQVPALLATALAAAEQPLPRSQQRVRRPPRRACSASVGSTWSVRCVAQPRQQVHRQRQSALLLMRQLCHGVTAPNVGMPAPAPARVPRWKLQQRWTACWCTCACALSAGVAVKRALPCAAMWAPLPCLALQQLGPLDGPLPAP